MYISNSADITPDKIDEILKELSKLVSNPTSIKVLTDKLPEIKKLSKRDIVKKIRGYYKAQTLVLVLGAGVSMDFGIPNWDVLLQKLLITTIKNEETTSTVLSKLFTNLFSPSPLIAGRYLQKYYDDKKLSFEEAVRNVLYENLDIDKNSPLLDEIVKLCVAPGKSPNIDSIITYNFDDILEQRIEKVKLELPYKSIYGIGMNPNGQLPIFHVHGYLPQSGKISSDNQITFGETVYHKQYTDIYSWNNIVQINKFRDANCVFIGSSLTDPNTRRLLDIARRQKGEDEHSHFIFKMRHKEQIVKMRLELLLRENKELLGEKIDANLELDKTVKLLIEIIERFEETDTESFGVKTIWIDEWSEIPEILKEIRTKN